MSISRRLARLALSGMIASVLLVAACASPGASPAAPSSETSTSPMASQSVGLDQAFIDMMVPHHESAVEMAKIALDRADHEELRSLAEDIIAAQEPEIEQLRQWRQAWFGSSETPPMEEMPLLPGMDMPGMEGHAMEGTMDMTADIDELRTADPFDRAFIDAMIEHHESAIAAAEIIKGATQRPELQDLADDIVGAQRREIEQMQVWRAEWYPG
jgi:uncharacterized protein (DUF305 family)